MTLRGAHGLLASMVEDREPATDAAFHAAYAGATSAAYHGIKAGLQHAYDA